MFIEALRRYDAVYREGWVVRLAKTLGPRTAILATIDEAIAAVLDGGSSDGCLLVNTALELSPHDTEVSAIVAHGLAEMEAFYCNMIERGQASGEISPDVAPVDTARGLLSLFIGLRVLSRSRPEETLLRSVASQAEALLS